MENCKGCHSMDGCHEYRNMSRELTDHYDKRIDKCPCPTCIIKMICDEPCEPYNYIWDN